MTPQTQAYSSSWKQKMSRMSKKPLNLRIHGITKLKNVSIDSQQALKNQDELPQYYILAVPYNCDINDPFLKVASVNVNEYRQRMLPNRESILMNPQLKYLSYQKRMKLVQPPPSFIQQVFNSLLQKINIQLAISKEQQFQKEVQKNQEKLRSVADIDTLMKLSLEKKEHQQNREIEYHHIYNIEGKQILKFQDISNTCRLLFVSQQKLKTPPKIQGLEGYINNLPAVKKDAVVDLFKRIQKQWANRMKDQILVPEGQDFDDQLSSQAPTQFFSPAFQLKQNIEITQVQICKILLKKVDQNSKNKTADGLRKTSKLRANIKQKHDRIQNALMHRFDCKIVQQKQKRNAEASSAIKIRPSKNLTGQESGTTIGKATFFNQEPTKSQQIIDPTKISKHNTTTNEGILQEASLKITKQILKPRFTRQEIERRGLFQPSKGKFKLSRTIAWNVHKKASEKRSFSPKNNRNNDSLSKQYQPHLQNNSITTDQSIHNTSTTKRSIIKISKGKFNGSTTTSLQVQDQKFMKANNELKEICIEFNLKRKDVFNIKSEFYSIVQMHQSYIQSRKQKGEKKMNSHDDIKQSTNCDQHANIGKLDCHQP